MKTIYMIRHAESEENRRLGSLKTAIKSISTFCLPKKADVSAAVELLNVSQQVDSNVSEFGKKQIAHMATLLKNSNFLGSSKIELVAHSPLIRAKETAKGMLQCMAPDMRSELVGKVEELDLLTEKSPAEWIPGNYASFRKRMKLLEDWIAEQPETVIALVGHSQFFKALLGLDYKFGNCDVVVAKFAPKHTEDTTNVPEGEWSSLWSDIQEVHKCDILPAGEESEINLASVPGT